MGPGPGRIGLVVIAVGYRLAGVRSSTQEAQDRGNVPLNGRHNLAPRLVHAVSESPYIKHANPPRSAPNRGRYRGHDERVSSGEQAWAGHTEQGTRRRGP